MLPGGEKLKMGGGIYWLIDGKEGGRKSYGSFHGRKRENSKGRDKVGKEIPSASSCVPPTCHYIQIPELLFPSH